MLNTMIQRNAARHGQRQFSSPAFERLVQGLKEQKKTVTVVESCCGGTINASIMAVPGSSQVYFGGSVAYNTKRAKPLLLNHTPLHESLLSASSSSGNHTAEEYVLSKQHWTAQTAIAFCEEMQVDYAIAEGGASGPTFGPKDLTTGFSVIAIAGKAKGKHHEKPKILAQRTIRSTHANRKANMRYFADQAAILAAETIGLPELFEASSKNEEQQDGADAKRIHLDRATHLRGDSGALEDMENSPQARFVVIRNKSTESLFDSSTFGVPTLALLSRADLPLHLPPSSFLGIDRTTDSPIFSVDLPPSDDLMTLSAGHEWSNIRTHAPLLASHDNELILYATALSNWKRTYTHCSQCGHTLQPVQGGTCLQCTSSSCGTLSWPRQDPSIIVLVTNITGDKALLARSPRHPPKMHTALAGFVEAGETMEQAVIREVWEETRAVVDPDSITYLSSQPWPFPRSCMIGFMAQADDSLPLHIDPNEIVSAGWFDRQQVHEAADIPGAVMNPEIAASVLQQNPSLQVLIPPQGVLARTLIDEWLLER